jgi:hypothetical protein
MAIERVQKRVRDNVMDRAAQAFTGERSNVAHSLEASTDSSLLPGDLRVVIRGSKEPDL